MIERQSIETGKPQFLLQNERKTSESFGLSVFLIFYMILYFYIKSVFRDESVARIQSYFSIFANLILFVLLFLKLFSSHKQLGTNIKSCLFLSFIFCVISYFVNFSGAEQLFGLSIILMCIVMFQLYPLKRSELNTIYALFFLAVIAVLLNGTTDLNSTDESKFNPNTCGFLLAMVFCTSLVRFYKSRQVADFSMLLGSFVLQIFFTSRTAMLGCLLFLIMFLLHKCIKRKYRFRTIFSILLVFPLLGIAAAYLYAEILYPWIGMGKIIIFGKDLFTGRQEIWHYTFESIKKHFWFGVGNHLNEDLLEAGFYDLITNAHNQSLGTIAAFGIFSFIAFNVAFAQVGTFTYKNKHQGNKFNIAPVLFLAVICIMNWFDVYLFSQYNWIAILISYGLICGYGKREEERS